MATRRRRKNPLHPTQRPTQLVGYSHIVNRDDPDVHAVLSPGYAVPRGWRLSLTGLKTKEAAEKEIASHLHFLEKLNDNPKRKSWPPKRTPAERFMVRRSAMKMRTEYPLYVIHPTLGRIDINNESELKSYLKRAHAANRFGRRKNPRGSDSSDYSSYLNDDLPKVRGKYKDRYTDADISAILKTMSSPGFVPKSPYLDGRDAYNKGLPRKHGPYLTSKRQKDLWFEGYDAAKRIAGQKRKNPLPKSAPSRALLCIGQLRDLEIYDPKTNTSKHIKTNGKWLAWDGRQFHVCNVKGQTNATLPKDVVQKHKKFHQANPIGKPFVGSMPTRSKSVKNVGLLKSVVYYVPTKIKSPGKNKYLWHHAFGDTGHKGGDNYPIKVMPMLQKDSAGNFFIKRRPGNIFKVDQWLRG